MNDRPCEENLRRAVDSTRVWSRRAAGEVKLRRPRQAGRAVEQLSRRKQRRLRELAAAMRWDATSTERLRSAGEETLSSLLQPGTAQQAGNAPRLIVSASPSAGGVEMEFLAVLEEGNLEDRLAYLDEQAESMDDREISFRLLRHHASSVQHQQYQGLDVVEVRVDRT